MPQAGLSQHLLRAQKEVDPRVEANKLAYDVLLIERARAKGELKEVPMSELERM